MRPEVVITKLDGQTGVVRPGSDGVIAIIAPSSTGTPNVAATYVNAATASTDYGTGELLEDAAHVMAIGKHPVVLVKADASVVGAYSTIVSTGAGTSVVTAGATAPRDNYDVIVNFVTGGTIGVTGITYTYSVDGGRTTSAVTALGTANSLTIPNTGVSLAFAAGTVLTGQKATFTTTAPQMSNADLTAALAGLQLADVPYEGVLVGGPATATTVSTLDSWLSAREAEGKFKFGLVNARMKGAAETESAYRTAMQTAFSAASSIRLAVGADGGDHPSEITGFVQPRPTALALAARAMSVDIGVDPARVSDGPVPGFFLKDDRTNPKYHDEQLSPGLDDLRLVTLRNFRQTAHINNAPVLSAAGSDYVYLQHVRIMNRACEVAYDALTSRLSQGVRKNFKAESNGKVYIFEEDAAEIEALVQALVDGALAGRVSGVKFQLSRTDDLASNQGATLTCFLSIASLAYIKKFNVTARYVRALEAA